MSSRLENSEGIKKMLGHIDHSPAAGMAEAVRATPEAWAAALVRLLWFVSEVHSDALACANTAEVSLDNFDPSGGTVLGIM